MLLSIALSTASRSRGFDASPPPSLEATVISRMRRLNILPRLASVAALRCLMFAHLLWPAMGSTRAKEDDAIIRAGIGSARHDAGHIRGACGTKLAQPKSSLGG